MVVYKIMPSEKDPDFRSPSSIAAIQSGKVLLEFGGNTTCIFISTDPHTGESRTWEEVIPSDDPNLLEHPAPAPRSDRIGGNPVGGIVTYAATRPGARFEQNGSTAHGERYFQTRA